MKLKIGNVGTGQQPGSGPNGGSDRYVIPPAAPGAGLWPAVVTEMVSAKAILYKNPQHEGSYGYRRGRAASIFTAVRL